MSRNWLFLARTNPLRLSRVNAEAKFFMKLVFLQKYSNNSMERWVACAVTCSCWRSEFNVPRNGHKLTKNKVQIRLYQ